MRCMGDTVLMDTSVCCQNGNYKGMIELGSVINNGNACVCT